MKPNYRTWDFALSLLMLPLAFACSDTSAESNDPMARRISQELVVPGDCNPDINIDRSLAVTEVAALQPFSMREMLETLAAQGPAPISDAAVMFANASASLGGCEEGEQKKLMGEFQMRCLDGTLGRDGTPEDTDPFGDVNPDHGYFPVGIFNRFDLAPADGATCGEYRIVFGRHSGIQNGFVTGERRLIIFEAVLPNAHPENGIEGCRPVQEFWASLTDIDDVTQRGTMLHDFFMNGLPGFGPVVHIDNYGLSGERGMGQIRSNSFLNHQWSQSEFRTDTCGGTCPLSLALTTTKDVPAPEVLGRPTAAGERHPFADEFRDTVLLPAALDPSHPIHSDDPNTIRFSFDDKFHAFESNAASQGGTLDATTLVASQSGLTSWLQDEMDSAAVPGVTLTASDIMARVQTQTCGGCHSDSSTDDLGNGVTQPASFDFTHINERVEDGPDGPRHVMSQGLKTSFLPFREQVLEAFLAPDSCQAPVSSFDDASDWSSSQAQISSSSLASEGSASVSVAHDGGEVVITSAPFVSSEEFGSQRTLVNLDLLVPSIQPNPWYLGRVELRMSCPAANLHGAYIGSEGLTSLPRDEFSELQFSMPGWVRNALAQNEGAECSWEIFLSVNDGAGAYLLDNLSVN